MTPDEFRELALSFGGAIESAHMQHPDFRAHGKIFATLGYPNSDWGMVKLSLPDQKHFVDKFPKTFVPAKGGWGLQGSTMVLLAAAKPDVIAETLSLAIENCSATVRPKKLAKPAR